MSQHGFVALGLQSTRRIMVRGLSIKNYEKLRREEEEAVVVYICRRTRLDGEALKETLSNGLYSVILWEASPCCNVPTRRPLVCFPSFTLGLLAACLPNEFCMPSNG
jgi:hypothetical protein